MRGSIPIGRLLGIRLYVHVTLLLFLLWIGWASWVDSGWRTSAWVLALVASVFLCIVLHELGHCVVAMRFGARVQSITLLPIGGVASLSSLPEKPVREFLVAVAGPAVNLVIAVVLILLRGDVPSLRALGEVPSSLPQLADGLIRTNLMLVLFNLIPAFPMDGGRMVRSGLAAFMPYDRATLAAALIGQLIAVGFMVFGWHYTPMLGIIGIFIFWSAGREAQWSALRSRLGDVTAGDVMRRHVAGLPVHAVAADCVDAVHAGQPPDFPIFDGDHLVGFLPRDRWLVALRNGHGDQSVASLMDHRFLSILAHTSVARLVRDAARLRQESFPVVEEGRLLGMVLIDDLRAVTVWPTVAAAVAKPGRWSLDVG